MQRENRSCMKLIALIADKKEDCMTIFPIAVKQVLNYEPESQLRSHCRGDLQEVKILLLV
jgi:hypothetical protein